MERERPVYTFVYDDDKRIVMAMGSLTMIVVGLLMLYLNHCITSIFGSFVLAAGLVKLFDVSFFKRLTIGKTRITKEWFFFGKRSIELSSLKVGVSKGMWTGIIAFQNKERLGLDRLTMQFEVFPIGNAGFNLIREVLIQKEIISGYELAWNNA